MVGVNHGGLAGKDGEQGGKPATVMHGTPRNCVGSGFGGISNAERERLPANLAGG